MTRWLAALAALLLLAACAPMPARIKGDAGMLAAQAARERALAGQDHWTVEGRLAVSNGHNGGSGSLTWTQDGDHYDFVIRAPVTGKSFRLSGDANGALLQGLDQGPLRGASAESLMARALGWQVPLGDLRAWVRGLRAKSGDARLRFGINGLPSLLQQDGWSVQYRDWFEERKPPLPRKVFAANGPYHVRLSIKHWIVR